MAGVVADSEDAQGNWDISRVASSVADSEAVIAPKEESNAGFVGRELDTIGFGASFLSVLSRRSASTHAVAGAGYLQKILIWLCGIGWLSDGAWEQVMPVIMPQVLCPSVVQPCRLSPTLSDAWPCIVSLQLKDEWPGVSGAVLGTIVSAQYVGMGVFSVRVLVLHRIATLLCDGACSVGKRGVGRME